MIYRIEINKIKLRCLCQIGHLVYLIYSILIFYSFTKITWQPLLAGGMAGVITWLVSLPADSIKTRLQTSSMKTYPRGVRSVFPIMMKEGGFLAFYRGVTTVMVRAFIANAACFYGFEFAFNIMDKFFNT